MREWPGFDVSCKNISKINSSDVNSQFSPRTEKRLLDNRLLFALFSAGGKGGEAVVGM